MMREVKKIISLFVSLIFIFSLLGCSPARPIKGSEDDLRVVGTVGEFEVLFEEFRFAALIYRDTLIKKHGEDIFEDPKIASAYAEQIREYVYDNMTYNYAILSLCREIGIEADDPVLQAAVKKAIDDIVRSLGGTRGKYKKYLKEGYMTDHFLRFNTCIDLMQNELFYAYTDDLALIETDDTSIADIISEEFVRTQHVYISKSNGKTDIENRDRINLAYSKLSEGADFMSVAKEYGDDRDMSDAGVYFPQGYMNEEYEEVAFSLGIDEISEIIEDSNGYYIIKRLPKDTAYIFANFYTLKEMYQEYKFLALIKEAEDELEFIPNEYLTSLDLLEIL